MVTAAAARRLLRIARVYAKQMLGMEPRVRPVVHPPLEFHGGPAGGWMILAHVLRPEAMIVDVGIGEDASFSESLIREYGCVVHAFDPTPRAIRYVQTLRNERLRLTEVGLGAESGRAPFFLPNDPSHVSGAISWDRHLTTHAIEVQLISVGDLFEVLRCERIDLLKLDIEGAEYEVIGSADFARYAHAIDQLCVEFHHRWSTRGRASTEAAVETLRRLGFDCVWVESQTNEEFSFVRREILSALEAIP